MCDRKTYVPWNKSNSSIYSESTRKESPASIRNKSSDINRNRTDNTKKAEYDRSVPLKVVSNASTTFSGEIPRSNYGSGYRERSNSSKIKPIVTKKDTTHPPISYGLLSRTGSQSRDTSPLGKPETDPPASTRFNYSRLHPRTHHRSFSRDRIEPTSHSTSVITCPGKTSSKWDEKIKFNLKSKSFKDDTPKYTESSKLSRNDTISPRYNISSRTPSREDLSKGSQKYIKSRFLPKNSIEKSTTALARIPSTKNNELSRRNRELSNALLIQQEKERLSRSTSRCSSRTSDEYLPKYISSDSVNNNEKSSDGIPMTPKDTSSTQESICKDSPKSKESEDKISDTKNSVRMINDSETQPDDESCSTISSKKAVTSWSSFLDMEFSCPETKHSSMRTDTNTKLTQEDEIPDASKISRTNSIGNFSHIKLKFEKHEMLRKNSPPSKLKSISSKQPNDMKQLPPQIPKADSPCRSTFSKLPFPTNKDFRKSKLNMNQDEHTKSTQQCRSTHSGSSAESEIADPDTTDISENLTSCSSYHHSCSSRSPRKSLNEKLRRSSSREASVVTSGSDDDILRKKEKQIICSTTTAKNSSLSAADVSQTSKASSRPRQTSRSEKSANRTEADVKSFFMRALGPVTNFFKVKSHSSTDNINWMESGTDTDPPSRLESELVSISEDDPKKILSPFSECNYSQEEQKYQNNKAKPIPAKIIVHRVESKETNCLGDNITQIPVLNCENSMGSVSSEPIQHMGQEDIHSRLKDSEALELTELHSKSVQEERQDIMKIPRNNSDSYFPSLSSSEKTNNSDSSKLPCTIEPSRVGKLDSEEHSWWIDSSQHEIEQETQGIGNIESKYALRHIDSGEKPWWLEEATEEDTNANIDTLKSKEHIRHQNSSEKPWWLEEMTEDTDNSIGNRKPKIGICQQDSDEEPWWLKKESEENTRVELSGDDQDPADDQEPIGDRVSPEGLETIKANENPQNGEPYFIHATNTQNQFFISRHTNIDEVLGGSTQIWNPVVRKIPGEQDSFTKEDSSSQILIQNTTRRNYLQSNEAKTTGAIFRSNTGRLDDAALQLYRDGDYGSYLDLEASISEQQEEFEGFQSNKKNSIVLRTQLSVRVHNIIEKLLTSEGRELRRALFSLKQIFQEDKDLVHEFVRNDGLSCLIKVGSEADQNYLNYILRALGQVMLYVDGMNGVMEHNQTIQWLYSLISSKFRLVVKTALKLLLVFVEYADSNCSLVIKAIRTVDTAEGVSPYHNLMKLLKDFEFADTELLIYAMTLINRILNGVVDQDTFYDQIDPLEEQGLETVIQRYMSKSGTDLDLLKQFQIYEAVLQYEDDEEPHGKLIERLDDSIVKMKRNRKSVVDSTERRKSRRHSTGNSPIYPTKEVKIKNSSTLETNNEDQNYESSSSHSSSMNSNLRGNNNKNDGATDVGVTPALKRRRERAERQKSFIKEQEASPFFHEENNENGTSGNQWYGNRSRSIQNNSHARDTKFAVNIQDSEEIQPWICSTTSDHENVFESDSPNDNDRSLLLQMKRENTVKDITQKLANQSILQSPSEENKMNRIGDMSGLISKAKEGLAKSKTKIEVLKQPTNELVPRVETKKSENELRWEELTGNLKRSLCLCDIDFTDLASEDEIDILAPVMVGNAIPPPPPLLEDMGGAPPPPPLSNRIAPPTAPSPAFLNSHLQKSNKQQEIKLPIRKNKKTVKLFWKEVRDEPVSHIKSKTGFIWDELYPVSVDTQKLEHLFETRARDLITKKQQDMNKNKEIIVLDPKRSNAINIGMTKLPPSRSIKTAILKMDATIMNREGIDKLLVMLPTEEERTKIQDAQAANPDLPLGSAEQFLLTLASISELPARLKLWAFKLDFENSEREIAEPLMDLKQGMEVLRENHTFRGILSTLLSIGNFLNGNEVKGFQIEYLTKVPEVKDTVHKHSLLHHLCHIVMEKFPNATDLYSEVGAITRASKVDFEELNLNVQRLKSDCKSSWDYLKLIAKHDGSTTMKVKMSDFLADCAERIILLEIIHRRIINRFHKFLLWLGIPLHQIPELKPNEFCRIVSEFALEYRTTRERVLQQLEKKANHRERNKTRGKMITDVGKFKSKEDRADAELRTLLGSDLSDVESLQGTLPWRRTRRECNNSFKRGTNGNFTDDDEEIFESLVKSATKGSSSRNTPRERKRTRHVERKSLRRTLKNGLSEEEKKHLSVYIEGYQL